MLAVGEPLYCGPEYVARYDADSAAALNGGECHAWSWKPAKLAGRYMPSWACRTWLTVTDVRVQRVQEISEDDAIAEGCRREHLGHGMIATAYGNYCELFDRINGKGAWDKNPWVWCIGFKLGGRDGDDGH